MNRLRIACVLAFVSALVSACTAAPEGIDEQVESDEDALRVTKTFVARGTAYYPDNSPLEGGFKDRKGKPLRTLQQFLAGKAEYVSVAMDTKAFPYGQRLRIKELEKKYGKKIVFRVVDTGGAFRGKGTSRIDVCVANLSASRDATINGTLHIDALDGSGDDEAAPQPSPPPADHPGAATDADEAPTEGAACSSDGACNPGNDGSGKICSGGRCVPGCRSDAQCPGSTRCRSGQCS